MCQSVFVRNDMQEGIFCTFYAFKGMKYQEFKANAMSLSVILLSWTEKNQCPQCCAWHSCRGNQECFDRVFSLLLRANLIGASSFRVQLLFILQWGHWGRERGECYSCNSILCINIHWVCSLGFLGWPGWKEKLKSESVSHSARSDSLWPHGLQTARLLCPWSSPDKNTGVGSLSLLQGIFLTQGLNLDLPHCRQALYQLSHQGRLW